MKKLFYLPMALALLALGACHKIKDFWDDHADNDIRSYRIVKWERELTAPGDDLGAVANISYNGHNNPVKVVFDSAVNRYDGTNWWFMYDNQNRLSKSYQYYGADYTTYREMSKYSYGSNGWIVLDTTYMMGSEAPGTAPNPVDNYYNVNHYTYDTYGRIIKIVRKDKFPDEMGDLTWEFGYDAAGNQVRPGLAYDNKVNFQRTSKVWQFINRDYSVNNPVPAVSYNSAKLPKKFDQDLEYDRVVTFLLRTFNHSTLTYKKRI